MPENEQTPTANAQETATATQEKQFTPPATQQELDRIIESRLARERAKYTDYDEVKAKAAKYDETVEASKTETQKLSDKNARLAAELAEYKLGALRHEVAAAKQVPTNLVEFIQGADREQMEAAADRLLAAIPKQPEQPNPQIGFPLNVSGPGAGDTSKDAQARAFFGI